jgi:glucosamine kinase
VKLLVGIDAGASHTEAVVARDVERVLARWQGGPGALRPGEESEVASLHARAVEGVVRQAGLSEPPSAVVVGAAGAGREEVRLTVEKLLDRALGKATRVRVTTDGEIALEAAFPGAPGIVVSAGSGSIAYARAPSGQLERVGGLGWRIGDEGSGYALGRAALNAIGLAADGRGAETELTDPILAAIGAGSLDQLVRWSLSASPGEIIALAQIVIDVADQGDAIAVGLSDQTAVDLAKHVETLLPSLGEVEPVRVALNGGLLRKGSPVRDSLTTILRESLAVEVLEDEVDPPLGALRLAARMTDT